MTNRFFIESTAEYSAACSGDECRKTLFGEANVIPRSLLRGEFIPPELLLFSAFTLHYVAGTRGIGTEGGISKASALPFVSSFKS